MKKRRVAVFRADLLPISETFIRDQVASLTSWEPILLGRREIPGSLATPNLQREVVPETGGHLSRALRYWFWRPDPCLVRCLQQLKVSLVHAHFGMDATDIWPSVKAARLPMLVTLHGMDINAHKCWWEQGHGGLRRRVYPRRLLEMAREPLVQFIAVSRAIKDRAIEYGIPDDKIAVCYIGVNTERFRPAGLPIAQRRKRILFIGRMVEKKAPLLMIRAYAEVIKRVPDAELAMIGTGPLLNEARKLAQELDAPVEFLGARDSNEVLAQLHQARAFCLPSVTALNGDAEGFGMVLLEAQSCGVPVISSALGGADEGLLDGITGYKFNPGDTRALTGRIFTLLDGFTDATAMSQSASNYVAENFDIRRLTRNLCSIYSKISQSMA